MRKGTVEVVLVVRERRYKGEDGDVGELDGGDDVKQTRQAVANAILGRFTRSSQRNGTK